MGGVTGYTVMKRTLRSRKPTWALSSEFVNSFVNPEMICCAEMAVHDLGQIASEPERVEPEDNLTRK